MTVVPTIEPGDVITKDPQALRVYQFNWTDFLAVLGATIGTSTMTITGPDAALTYDYASIIAGSLKTQVRLVGGTPGALYVLTNHIVTNGSPSQEDDRSVQVWMENR